MKYVFLLLITSMWLLTAGCGKCGRNVNLGKKTLQSQSVSDWFTYKKVNEVIYQNSEGETINMHIEERNEEMIHQFFRHICYESDMDNAHEYFYGEYVFAQYEGSHRDVHQVFSISLGVCQMYYGYEPEELLLQDQVTYSFDFFSPDQWIFGGVYIYTASYRGNPVPDDSTGTDHPELVKEMELNGTTYQDVWIFSRENTPSIYIQKGKGIIAYTGPDNEIWERQ